MTARRPRRLLLSSVTQPFGEAYGDGFGVSFEGSHQLMWAQGIFRSRGTTTQWGIELIAANLQIPTTTLHYPTMEQFVAELRRGYDYVGIAFVSSTLHKLIPMVKAVRQHAPGTEIILGGYGTALDRSILEPLSDHICRGEGVRFMRELLGEPVDAPIVQPEVVQQQRLFSLPIIDKTAYIFAGLGCPNGCDFCATSHYFERRHIKFLPDGPSILGAIQKIRVRHPDMASFWVNDEDFLLDESRGRGFLEAIRRSSLPPLSLACFSSVRALSKYTAAELVEMGIDWIWVGFEGKRAGYTKMEGRPYRELFADLHQHGISVMASMIIGFDYQKRETIEEEYEELLSMRPTMCQFLIYGPAHNTPAYARLAAERRIEDAVFNDHHLHDGFSLTFRHPNFTAPELEAIQRRLYREEFARLGPSVLRVGEDWLTGHETLRHHPSPRVRAKAEKYGRDAHMVMTLCDASQRYVNPAVARWIGDLKQRIAAVTGPMTVRERLIARAMPAALRYTDFKLRHGLDQQPTFTRHSFRMSPMQRRVEAWAARAREQSRDLAAAIGHSAAGLRDDVV